MTHRPKAPPCRTTAQPRYSHLEGGGGRVTWGSGPMQNNRTAALLTPGGGRGESDLGQWPRAEQPRTPAVNKYTWRKTCVGQVWGKCGASVGQHPCGRYPEHSVAAWLSQLAYLAHLAIPAPAPPTWSPRLALPALVPPLLPSPLTCTCVHHPQQLHD